MDDSLLTLQTTNARLQLSQNGGIMTSLVVGEIEILKAGAGYGCFPMSPWCGRLRHGRMTVNSLTYQFPINADPHAIHGTVRNQSWDLLHVSSTSATLTCSLTDPWPLPGQVTQHFELTDDQLKMSLEVSSTSTAFPAQAGWHPWFKRSLIEGSDPVVIDFAPEWQELRGTDYLPAGVRIDPQPGPWDDCFGMPEGVDITLTWPGLLLLVVRSPEQWVVIYDLEQDSVCVEPQSGPPDGINSMPQIVTPKSPLFVESSWEWKQLSGRDCRTSR